MSGIPYLGSKISLISKSEIRYEGILVDVNPQDSTITFEQVRFFGTEGRRPGDEIAPMDKVFDCVVFRSADIKDLQVYETPAPEVKKQKEPEFPDPAVVSFASGSSSAADKSSGNAPSGFKYQTAKASEEVKMPKVSNYASAAAQSQQQQGQGQTKSFTTRNTHHHPGHSNNYNQNRQHGGRSIVVPQSEFDFSQANAKFSKDELTAGTSASGSDDHSAPAVPSYNKNLSFFDDISCQANSESTKFADRSRTERHLNMETFGQAAPPRRYGHRGGRGRGGYNRGGYNRGGYNNNNNNNNSSYNNRDADN